MQPNLWSLSGDQLHVLYAASDVEGRPSLSYRDAQQSLRFAGDELRVLDTADLATLVSVTVRETADTGSMTFTLVLPRVSGPPPSGPRSARSASRPRTAAHR